MQALLVVEWLEEGWDEGDMCELQEWVEGGMVNCKNRLWVILGCRVLSSGGFKEGIRVLDF